MKNNEERQLGKEKEEVPSVSQLKPESRNIVNKILADVIKRRTKKQREVKKNE